MSAVSNTSQPAGVFTTGFQQASIPKSDELIVPQLSSPAGVAVSSQLSATPHSESRAAAWHAASMSARPLAITPSPEPPVGVGAAAASGAATASGTRLVKRAETVSLGRACSELR